MITDISVTQDKVLMDTYKHIDLPIGAIIMNAGNNGSTSFGNAFLLCNGSSQLIASYPELYAIIGERYNLSAPTGFFNLPNFVNRFPMGLPNVGGSVLTTNSDPVANPLLRQGGNAVIQSAQFPHGHSKVDPELTGVNQINLAYDCENNTDPIYNTYVGASYFGNIQTARSTAESMPPYYTLNYFIYTGKGVIG